jgi:hypothetical protein
MSKHSGAQPLVTVNANAAEQPRSDAVLSEISRAANMLPKLGIVIVHHC